MSKLSEKLKADGSPGGLRAVDSERDGVIFMLGKSERERERERGEIAR